MSARLPALQLSLQFGVANHQRSAGSEYRKFVGDDDLPINQRTTFHRIPVTAGVQWNLVPAGRTLGRLAWVPTRVVPYVAAGGGFMSYRFRQQGEFIDAQSLDIFRSTMESRGWAPVGYLAAGTTFNVSPDVGITMELRRDQARGETYGAFRDFRTIDLASTSATVGFTFRY